MKGRTTVRLAPDESIHETGLLGFAGIVWDCALSFKRLRGIGRASRGGSVRTETIVNPSVRGAGLGRKTSLQGRFRGCEPALKSRYLQGSEPDTGRATTSRSVMVTVPGPNPNPGRHGLAPAHAAPSCPGSRTAPSPAAKIADTIQTDRFGMGKPGLAGPARGPAGLRVVIPRRPRTDSRTFDLAVLAKRCTAQMEVAVAGLASTAIHANTCDPPGILFVAQAIFGFPPTIAKRVENMARHRRRQPRERFPRGFSGSGAGHDHPRSNATACQRGC